jgi:hypothetical protein
MRNGTRFFATALMGLIVFGVSGCGQDTPPTDTTTPAPAATGTATPPESRGSTVRPVNDARIANMEVEEPGAWLSYGRNYEEQRFSPLTQINRETVQDLGIAFYKDLNTIHPMEATPLMAEKANSTSHVSPATRLAPASHDSHGRERSPDELHRTTMPAFRLSKGSRTGHWAR